MSQKALILPEAHAQFTVANRAIPKPGPGELVVKVQATSLNPVEWKIQAFNFLISEYPAVLGCDSAGIVEEVGEGVTGFKKGDEVFNQGDFNNDRGTYQQYVIASADLTAKKPSSISFDEAASFPVCLATAVQGLYGDRTSSDTPKLPPSWEAGGEEAGKGKAIVVLGGSSSVGQYVIQLAKLSGFSSIITTASLHNATHLESLGATTIIDRRVPDVRSEITKSAKGLPIEYVYDAVSHDDTQSIGWDVLSPNGALVVVVPPSKVDPAKYPNKNVVDNVHGNVNSPHLHTLGVSLYKALPKLIETGKLMPNRVEVLPDGLNGIADGLARIRAEKVSGVKLIARPQETA